MVLRHKKGSMLKGFLQDGVLMFFVSIKVIGNTMIGIKKKSPLKSPTVIDPADKSFCPSSRKAHSLM